MSPTITPTKAPRRRTATVPLVVDRSIVEAKAALAAKGFGAQPRTVEQSACVGPRVLRQDPPRGSRRDVGTRVRLDVVRRVDGRCGLDLPPAAPDLDAAGRAFVEFARGAEPDEHLLRAPVRLHLGGRLLHTIPDWRAVQRNSYGWLCPSAGTYSGLSCPLSATRTIRRYPGPMAVTSAPPAQPCATGGTLAEKRERTVTLTPDEGRSCLDYFAVELEVAPDGRLVAVNLIVSEP